MEPIKLIDLDTVPRSPAGRVLWAEIIDQFGLDMVKQIEASATYYGDHKLVASAKIAYTRQLARQVCPPAPRGRPTKGAQKRTARLVCRVSPWVRDAIESDATPDESLADVITRWAEQHAEARS